MDETLKKGLYYPLFVDLKRRKVVVVGGGRVAERKVLGLLDTGAAVTVVSPEITDRLHGLHAEGRIAWTARSFLAGDLHGASLVIASTDDPEVQRAVYSEAEARNIFCNTVDQPEFCSFIVPSVVRRGDLCLAISTAGKSPALARRLRQEFEEVIGPSFEGYVALLGDLRDLLLASCPDPAARKDRCMSLAAPEVREWIREDRWDRVEAWAVSLCGEDAAGVVRTCRSASAKRPEQA